MSTTKDSIEIKIIKKSSVSKVVNILKEAPEGGRLDEDVIVEDTIEILESFSEKDELSAITAIAAICSKMSTQAILSLAKTLSSLVRAKMIEDILKRDAVDEDIDN
jgi:hypothetical protein